MPWSPPDQCGGSCAGSDSVPRRCAISTGIHRADSPGRGLRRPGLTGRERCMSRLQTGTDPTCRSAVARSTIGVTDTAISDCHEWNFEKIPQACLWRYQVWRRQLQACKGLQAVVASCAQGASCVRAGSRLAPCSGSPPRDFCASSLLVPTAWDAASFTIRDGDRAPTSD